MYPTYQKLGKYMEVDFVPYGNAHQQQDGDSWTFECQHGPDECHGNMQQSCMFHYVTDQDPMLTLFIALRVLETSLMMLKLNSVCRIALSQWKRSIRYKHVGRVRKEFNFIMRME